MKKPIAASAIALLVGLGFTAAANTPAPVPSPSASIGIDIDVKPAEGVPGSFMVSSVVTDLENGKVIARPGLVVGANSPARIETGNAAQWNLQIEVLADGVSRKATYEASFTRQGKLVSKQRVSVNLDV